MPGSSVYGILQAKILEWVAISFSRESSQFRNRTWVSRIADRFITDWAMKEAHLIMIDNAKQFSEVLVAIYTLIKEWEFQLPHSFAPLVGWRTTATTRRAVRSLSTHGLASRQGRKRSAPAAAWFPADHLSRNPIPNPANTQVLSLFMSQHVAIFPLVTTSLFSISVSLFSIYICFPLKFYRKVISHCI